MRSAPAQDAGRQEEKCLQECKQVRERDAQQVKWQGEQPDDRLEQQNQQGKRLQEGPRAAY